MPLCLPELTQQELVELTQIERVEMRAVGCYSQGALCSVNSIFSAGCAGVGQSSTELAAVASTYSAACISPTQPYQSGMASPTQLSIDGLGTVSMITGA